jgi:hypothetical protein
MVTKEAQYKLYSTLGGGLKQGGAWLAQLRSGLLHVDLSFWRALVRRMEPRFYERLGTRHSVTHFMR